MFSLNLIVCTLDRFPNIWRLITMDNLALEPDRIIKMPQRQKFASELPLAQLTDQIETKLPATHWKFRSADKDGGRLFSAQKGNWTRLGVIMVHTSILVIFAGAIIGAALGYKGWVMITEGQSVKQIYAYDAARTAIPLGFEVRCDDFQLELYDNGAPKEYRSDLTVLKDGKAVLQKSIVVNSPLKYGGFTFYQSSYQGYDNAMVMDIENDKDQARQKFSVSYGQQVQWPEEHLSFGIVNRMQEGGMGSQRFKVWLKSGDQAPVEFWVNSGQAALVERPAGNYTVSVRPLYATGLQVAKDPGVWYVYLGCMMMLLGLYIAFFLSHRKVWLYISSNGSRSDLWLTGSSNKNKIGFENDFTALVAKLEQDESLKLTKE